MATGMLPRCADDGVRLSVAAPLVKFVNPVATVPSVVPVETAAAPALICVVVSSLFLTQVWPV